MKKVITLCLFVFALFLGTQTTVAQNSKLEHKIEVNTTAAEKTEALRKHVKFDDTQKEQVYEALVEYTQATVDLKKQKVVEEGVVEKIKTLLDNRMKTILSDMQFELYKTFEE